MERWAKWVGALLVCCLVAASTGAAIAAEAAKDIDGVFKQVAAYKYGETRAPLIEAEKLIRATHNNEAERKKIVARLVGLLTSDATTDSKRFACRQLSIVAGPEAVAAANKLLPDPDLSHMGRMILERVPGDEAGAALRKALGTLKGKLLIGVVNSLGERREAAAAPDIAKLLGNADAGVAAAAATALGKIGGTAATTALKNAKDKAPEASRPAAVNAYLRCADHLVAAGKANDAAAIYLEMHDPKQAKVVRIAALRGLVVAGSPKAMPLVTAALTGKDAQMQAVATSFIREMKGEAATKAFGDMLPKLAPATQTLVIAALAERADPAARPAILTAAKSTDAGVRAAAVDALATLGGAGDVPMLAKLAATGAGAEKNAAAGTLGRLQGKGVDDAILKAMQAGDPAMKVALINVLGARRYAGAVPVLLKAAADPDEGVRVEAIKVLGLLGDEKTAPELVELLLGAKSNRERGTAEKSLQTVCGRIKDADQRVVPLLAALPTASVDAKRSLLTLLGRFGGTKALAAVRTARKDTDAGIQDAAIRALASWPDTAALNDLLTLSKDAPKPNQKIIALRGYVRLIGLPSKRKTEETLKMYQGAMASCTRPDEKKLVLGGLANVRHVEALKMAAACLNEKPLIEEASVAVVNISKAIGRKNKAIAAPALTKVTQESKNKRVRRDAANILKGLK